MKFANAGNMDKSMMTMVLITFVISIVISFLPLVNVLLYPFKLFATFVHESCHGLAAIATFGKWKEFTVSTNTSGLAMTQGGLRMIIIPAGYLGASLIGGILLLLSSKRGRANVILIILSLIMAAITLIFARNWVSIVVGLGFGIAFFSIGSFTKGFLPAFTLNFLAVNLSLNALTDVKTLFVHTTANAGNNDAVAMHREVLGIGSLTWAIIYIACSLLITYIFLKKSLKKGTEQE